MIRKLIHFTCAVLLTGVVVAQDVSLRSDHPDRYVVVKGDTLWDIAGRFLDKPWQWPAIWQANPQIENPHLIYPGDVVSLVYVDGVPQLRLSRGDSDAGAASAGMPPRSNTVKLSPSVRILDKTEPINAIPLKSIEPFLREVRVVSPGEYETLPYIVANMDDKITAVYSDKVYARGLNGRVGEEFVVARLYSIYDRVGKEGDVRRVLPQHHWKKAPNVKNRNEGLWNQTLPWNHSARDPVGYELVGVSHVRVTSRSGEISELDVLRDRTEIMEGDVILPLEEKAFDDTFFPHAMDSVPPNLRVLATKDALYGVGQYQIVALSGGKNQGVESGHVFSIFRPGRNVDDRIGYRWGSFSGESKVTLPDNYHGLVMVFRSFDNISYAMVMSGGNLVREYDWVRHPSEQS